MQPMRGAIGRFAKGALGPYWTTGQALSGLWKDGLFIVGDSVQECTCFGEAGQPDRDL